MTSIDLLEELKLTDYYPQKLSFSEAIQLRQKCQNVSQEKYGLEIVRRLLMFDSTAVVSVTTEITKRLSNTGSTETDIKVQPVADAVRTPRQSRFSCRSKAAEHKERKLHPMDLLVVVMNCCDDFLRQVLVEKMFTNKLSIPILLPSVRNGSYTLLLFSLRSLIPLLKDRTGEGSLTDTLVDIKNPVLSFIRVGSLHRSKSRLLNELLGFNAFNTFFHSECPNGNAKRSVSNGSIEAAWFQSETATEEEFNCTFFTALNLRGNGKDYPKQTQFLYQSSTLVVFMVDSCESFEELYENVLKAVKGSQTKVIVCCISPKPPDDVNKIYSDVLDELEACEICDWTDDGEKKSDNEFTNDLRKTISEFSRSEHGHSNQLPTYTNIVLSGKNFGFSLDEDKFECTSEKASTDEFVGFVLNQLPDCKPLILPLQSEPWEKIGKLEREQRGKSHNKNLDEHYIAEKEKEKRQQRVVQCLSLIQQNKIAQTFSLKFHLLQEQNLSFYLNSCKIKLDSRSRVVISDLLAKYKNKKQKQSHERESEAILSQMELKIANSTIGLEHILREHGQMYEAVISEESRMKEELKNAPLTPDVIRNFPKTVARLLLMGQPLELMDGDASNVPIIWLNAVFNQIKIITKNAKVFVLSIIGVQSSGKSTLLNALFGLQFPVSAGRCTKGIYCHLVPVDKESLIAKYDYVLVVDTEGLGSSQCTENSTFRDNELATFAIGLADATIINMKGENWAEMKDILQIVGHGLIRCRKTKAELELMPRCMFVHQNVPAVDAEERNRLGQQKQLKHLDTAIKAAAHGEGFTDISKFNQVIKYDPSSHSWYFPDLWNGRPPKSRISQDYIGKTNELRQYLMQLMKDNPSKLTISSFFLRMSDLWNAMLHNDFVLCFRNTQEITSGTVLNDKISHEVDGFKSLNKLQQTKIRELISSFIRIEDFRAEKDRILKDVRDAVENNFTNMKTTLQVLIDASDICATLKDKYVVSLSEIKDGERLRISNEIEKDIGVHMRKLEYDDDHRVKDFKARLAGLEKCFEQVEKDNLNERATDDFEESWRLLIAENKILLDERMNIVESEIKEKIDESIRKLVPEYKNLLEVDDCSEIFRTPLVDEMPQVTEKDLAENQNKHWPNRWIKDLVYSKPNVYMIYSSLEEAHKKWKLQFQNQRGLQFDASLLEQVLFEVGRLLGISSKEHEAPPGRDEICAALPPGYRFTSEYCIRFIRFACHYTYNLSLANSKEFISMTDPLADIDERCKRSVSCYRLKTEEANINFVSKQIFNYAKGSFVKSLGELIKPYQENPTFESKRAFLRTILIDLALKAESLPNVNEAKQSIFKDFMSYVEMGESETSESFFHNAIIKLLKEIMTKECESESQTYFQKMAENNVGKIIEETKHALRHAETNGKGCKRDYVQIFKADMKVTTDIDLRIINLTGFTEAVVKKIDNLYDNFLSQVNSSFETLVCEDDKAIIRKVFEKIIGCREKCPFCSAPCSQSLHQHGGDHRANHYPMGVSGTVDCKGLFTDTQETQNALEEKQRMPRKLSVSTCQAMVGTRVDIRTKFTVKKYIRWRRFLPLWNYHSFKNYREIEEYKDWDIPCGRDHSASLFWKWFMTKFDKDLAEHYNELCPDIPPAWRDITWEEARKSLDEPDFYSLDAEEC